MPRKGVINYPEKSEKAFNEIIMCGITGFISNQYTKRDLVEMTNTLNHRGPDADGFFFDDTKGVGLGHKRLSILDLSDAANQPMISSSGRYIMVYNGEIYNYKELSKELTVNLNTNSDSEVILAAYEKWGHDFVHQLNGMFAIAIYDLHDHKLFLYRDRLGIKPLYYYHNSNSFVFSSEIKSFKKLSKKFKLNKQAISNYFHLGFISKDQTIYEDIFQLPSGSFAIYEQGNFQISSYWDIHKKINPVIVSDFSQAKKQLKELLQSAVQYRMISDVPLGTFLSGGTDSSIVTAIASEISSQPINTFSIGFKENKFNESEYAQKIAKHLKTNHHEFIVSHIDALEVLHKTMDNYDQPFVDSSAIPTFLVSELAKKHVTVALSGDGGDELFMGYGTYNWGKRLSNPIIWNSRKAISLLLNLSSKGRNKRAAQVFDCLDKNRLKNHIFSQEQYLFSEKEIHELLRESQSITFNESNLLNRRLNFNEEQGLFELTNYLKDDLLVKVDRSSMLNSLEVRVPLLDHRVVEYSLNMHSSLKINNKGVQKYILKEILYDSIPKSMLDHPKWGFSIPLSKWLTRELAHLIEEYLDEDFIVDTGIFNPTYVRQLKNRFLSGEGYLYNRIWQIIIFNKFLKRTSHLTV